MKPKHKLHHLLALTGISLLAVSSAAAQATSNTWNTDAPGNWTDPLNWQGDTAYAEGADNTATFGNFISLDRIVTLDAPITIGNITASDTSHNYTISGANTLTLDRTTGVPTIDVTTNNRTLTIASNITGTDGLNKTGAGTASISGVVTLSGGLEVNGGRLLLSNASNVITGGFILNNGSTLGNANGAGDMTTATLNNNNITVNGAARIGFTAGATTNGGITLNAGSVLTLGVANSGATINGAVTGSGSIIVDRTGLGTTTINLNSTANTFTGAISLTATNGRTLSVNSLADTATLGAGNISFGGGTATNTNHTFALGSGAIAPLTLTNRQFVIASGTQVSAIAITNNSSQAFTVNTDLIVSATATGNRTLTLSGTGAGLSSFNGDIDKGTLTTLGITKSGSGTWVLGGENTYNGNTTVSAGTLTLAASSSTQFQIGASGVNNAVLGTGTVNLNGTFFFDLTNAGTNDGDLWNIVSVGTLTESYGSTFGVSSTSGLFTDNSGVWSLLDGNNTWTFTESTGVLGLTVIPEPSTALLSGLGLLALLRRRR